MATSDFSTLLALRGRSLGYTLPLQARGVKSIYRTLPIIPLINITVILILYMLLSIKAVSCDFDTAPTFVASTFPPLNNLKVGIPRIPYFG